MTWTPVAMSDTVERHASTGPRLPDARAVVLSEETHDFVAIDALTKAATIADRITALDAELTAARAEGAPSAAASRGRIFAAPTTGVLTSAAGPRWGATHYGLDIANRVGTPVFAVTDGVVVESGPASGFGLWVRIRHADGSTSVYGHLDRSLVREGQRIRAGDRVALMGNRGQSTGPHLHLEIWSSSGQKLDPRAWLSDRGVEVG